MHDVATNKPFIRGIAPQKEHEIAITVTAEDFVEARKFRKKYLTNHPMCGDFTEEEMELLSVVFLSVAGSLPIFSYDLIRWTTETCMFDGDAAVREYAENVLGMEPVEAAVDRGPGRRWSPMTASPAETAKLAYASYSDVDVLTVAEEIVALVNGQGRRGEDLPLKAA
jgi:hypothetical protein